MAGPLLYKPPPRWQVWAALGGAIAIHLAAVGAYAIKHEAPPVDLSDIPTATVEATLQPEDQPTPPPEDIPVPEPPPVPEVAPEFHEEKPPPPKNAAKPSAPVKAPQQAGLASSISGAKMLALYHPKPPYPYEARARHQTGDGVCVLSVDTGTGNVTEATIAKSTGSPALDNAANSTFKTWRFQPGKVASRVKVPFTFTMSGISY